MTTENAYFWIIITLIAAFGIDSARRFAHWWWTARYRVDELNQAKAERIALEYINKKERVDTAAALKDELGRHHIRETEERQKHAARVISKIEQHDQSIMGAAENVRQVADETKEELKVTINEGIERIDKNHQPKNEK